MDALGKKTMPWKSSKLHKLLSVDQMVEVTVAILVEVFYLLFSVSMLCYFNFTFSLQVYRNSYFCVYMYVDIFLKILFIYLTEHKEREWPAEGEQAPY